MKFAQTQKKYIKLQISISNSKQVYRTPNKYPELQTSIPSSLRSIFEPFGTPYLVESEGTYKVAFKNESGTYKDILSPTNRWLVPDVYLKIFGRKFMKDIGFDADKPKSGTKSKIPKKKMKQIEMYVDEIDDNTKQFASVFNELPTSEDNQDNIMLQDIITKNEIPTDN